ncbi:hypothetical protein DH2020_024985 [Rehmannia glutinosa]|uniref:Uncharacterized protein n=1 Tax=Rehmannia glutinosa TaxID=99300 RepID=A0ABR0W4M7_REHGL
MAISSYPTPADAGVLCVILANTAISISIVKELFRSMLHDVIGIRIASWEELSVDPSDSAECHRNPSESYMDAFEAKSQKCGTNQFSYVIAWHKSALSACLNSSRTQWLTASRVDTFSTRQCRENSKHQVMLSDAPSLAANLLRPLEVTGQRD